MVEVDTSLCGIPANHAASHIAPMASAKPPAQMTPQRNTGLSGRLRQRGMCCIVLVSYGPCLRVFAQGLGAGSVEHLLTKTITHLVHVTGQLLALEIENYDDPRRSGTSPRPSVMRLALH